jgi:hypothetical protein
MNCILRQISCPGKSPCYKICRFKKSTIKARSKCEIVRIGLDIFDYSLENKFLRAYFKF